MENNTNPENNISGISANQHISSDEIGELPTQEELAECLAAYQDCEECSLNDIGMEIQSEPQSTFDRKAEEQRMITMGFTLEELKDMSDDEIKETIAENLAQEPLSFNDNSSSSLPEDCIIDDAPVYVFGGNQAEVAANDSQNHDTQTRDDNTVQPPKIIEVPEDCDLSAALSSIPSGIIETQLPYTDIISLEMKSERTSVIVFPNKTALLKTSEEYPNAKTVESVSDKRLLLGLTAKVESGTKAFATPDTTEALCSFLKRSNADFFLTILDMDILQGEASYRDAVLPMYDAYSGHTKDKRCLVTSDLQAFSDPAMVKEKRYIVKNHNVIKRKPTVISCKNITLALKNAIEGIRRPIEVAVLYGSVQQSRLAILNLKEDYQKECGIVCSEGSKEEAGEFYLENNIQHKKRIVFYTRQIDMSAADNPIALITVSDTSRGCTTLSLVQIIRCQDVTGTNGKLSKDIIIHNTSYCHPEEWKCAFTSFIEQGNRISGLLNATEKLAEGDKALARFFRPIRRIVQYKVGIRGRFQQVSLLRQDSSRVWKPSYMAIDSLLVRTRLLERLYSKPEQLSEALREYYPKLVYETLSDEVPESQKNIEKAERRKSLDRASGSRSKELDRILELYRENKLTDRVISRDSMTGRSSKRKIWREFQRINPYIETEEAVGLLKGIKSGNRIGFKNLNNSLMFWALDNEHPLKQSVHAAFKAGESYTGKEIKERMSPIIKYHFNRDYLTEDEEKKDTGRKLITLFKSFLNAERPRSEYIVPENAKYHTHKAIIEKDDNDRDCKQKCVK